MNVLIDYVVLLIVLFILISSCIFFYLPAAFFFTSEHAAVLIASCCCLVVGFLFEIAGIIIQTISLIWHGETLILFDQRCPDNRWSTVYSFEHGNPVNLSEISSHLAAKGELYYLHSVYHSRSNYIT